MKNLFPILLWLIVGSVSSQPSPTFDYQPYFSAVIVKDLESSVKWYQSVFNMRVKDRMGDDKTDYKVGILESGHFLLELLQLKNSQEPAALLTSKPEGAKIQGHFKIGFKVSDMDKCLQALKTLNIDPGKIYTDSKTRKRNLLITDPDGNLIQFFE